ncbi:hypothetical protein ACJRO7_011771 [Eucalyptus globulus]|uniref:Uncharacterized protein n=1 Tax=Eucalyptus globulus TaxID=34317 RepID=A0ABD3LGH2_EUCGL
MGHGKRPIPKVWDNLLEFGPGMFLWLIDDGDSVGPTSLEWGSTFRCCRSGLVGGATRQPRVAGNGGGGGGGGGVAATVKCFHRKVYGGDGPEWT